MLAMVLLVLAIVIAIYVFIVRPILKTQPAFSEAFKAEASFFDKVRAKVVGWRTRIAARLTMLAGLFVGLYDQALPIITGQDWTPLTAKVPAWALPVGMVGVGLLFAWLRKITDNPPQIVTQKDDDGVAKVVDVIKPAA
ncbi:TRAP-type C4-dicarboxylate transport system permease small subunit [Nitrobacteraceae bacterium AZCC 1564]